MSSRLHTVVENLRLWAADPDETARISLGLAVAALKLSPPTPAPFLVHTVTALVDDILATDPRAARLDRLRELATAVERAVNLDPGNVIVPTGAARFRRDIDG